MNSVNFFFLHVLRRVRTVQYTSYAIVVSTQNNSTNADFLFSNFMDKG